MKQTHYLPIFLLAAGFLSTSTASAQWFSPWSSENDLATAWGLEPSALEDPNEGPGETIDYSTPEQPFKMNVESGSHVKPFRTAPAPVAPPRTTRPTPAPAAPAPTIRQARPTPPPVPARPARPSPPRQYYQRRAPAPRRDYGRNRQPAPLTPYYAPRPLPPLRMPVPMDPFPYYRR